MAKPVGKWTVEQIDEARAMLARGLSLKAVGEHLGVSADTVKCKVDPAYLERRKQQNNLNRRANRRYEPMNSIGRITVHDRVNPDCVEARLAEIPRFDRRDFTSRLMGDPLPERSALFRKHLDRET